MRLKTAMAAVAAAALTACASGGGSSAVNEPIRALLSADALMFVSFDADGDLSVSTPELEAGSAREFARADANSDGQLQPIEFQTWSNQVLGGSQLGPYRLDFDRNVDNVITRAEFDTEIRARFSDYDQDESDSLSRSEFVRLIGQARPPAPRREPSGFPPSS
ncbi:MAG: EF-hand domain-containing protein [Hyphomonadaceae bacterium]